MEDRDKILEYLAAIKSLLQRLPEIQAVVFIQMLEEYEAAKLHGQKANELWEIPQPNQR